MYNRFLRAQIDESSSKFPPISSVDQNHAHLKIFPALFTAQHLDEVRAEIKKDPDTKLPGSYKS